MKKKIAELAEGQQLVNTPSQEIESKLTLLESEENEFLKLVNESADLYGKDEFQASFDKLLKYQPEEKPEDKFMFAYVFNEIETKNYDYLEDFLKSRTIPDQPNSLISQIMETSFKSSPQTRL